MGKRIRRKSGKKHRVSRRAHLKGAAPKTPEQYWAMSERDRRAYDRSIHVVTLVRSNGLSLRKAAKQYKIGSQTAARLVGGALRKQPNGRYVARPSDKLLRILLLPTPEGLQEIATLDSRQASQLANYWNAVHRYLTTGDASHIRQFDGKQIIDANSLKVPLLTDLQELDRQGNAGNFSFESIYRR
jgi:hypothetical protein